MSKVFSLCNYIFYTVSILFSCNSFFKILSSPSGRFAVNTPAPASVVGGLLPLVLEIYQVWCTALF